MYIFRFRLIFFFLFFFNFVSYSQTSITKLKEIKHCGYLVKCTHTFSVKDKITYDILEDYANNNSFVIIDYNFEIKKKEAFIINFDYMSKQSYLHIENEKQKEAIITAEVERKKIEQADVISMFNERLHNIKTEHHNKIKQIIVFDNFYHYGKNWYIYLNNTKYEIEKEHKYYQYKFKPYSLDWKSKNNFLLEVNTSNGANSFIYGIFSSSIILSSQFGSEYLRHKIWKFSQKHNTVRIEKTYDILSIYLNNHLISTIDLFSLNTSSYDNIAIDYSKLFIHDYSYIFLASTHFDLNKLNSIISKKENLLLSNILGGANLLNFSKFLEIFPNSIHINDVKKRYEKELFTQIIKISYLEYNDDFSSYNSYIKNYNKYFPNGRNIKSVQELEVFSSAYQTKNIYSYIKKYPNGTYETKLRNLIKENNEEQERLRIARIEKARRERQQRIDLNNSYSITQGSNYCKLEYGNPYGNSLSISISDGGNMLSGSNASEDNYHVILSSNTGTTESSTNPFSDYFYISSPYRVSDSQYPYTLEISYIDETYHKRKYVKIIIYNNGNYKFKIE